MIKQDIAAAVSQEAAISKVKAEEAVEAFLHALKTALLERRRIELRGFGVFKVKPRKRGVGRNPRTGQEIKIPPGWIIRFKPSRGLQLELLKEAPAVAGDPRSPATGRQQEARRKTGNDPWRRLSKRYSWLQSPLPRLRLGRDPVESDYSRIGAAVSGEPGRAVVEVTARCPRCKGTITATPDERGLLVCPQCGAQLRVPAAPSVPLATASVASPGVPASPAPPSTVPPGETSAPSEALPADIRALLRGQEQASTSSARSSQSSGPALHPLVRSDGRQGAGIS